MSKDIDDIVRRMDSMVDATIEKGSADGYFAAMYLGVTQTVQAGLSGGLFATPDRLANLTTTFANRYLDAWDTRNAGGKPTGSWGVAFDAASQWSPTVLQHLLLGMNAHINLDLGISAAQVAPGKAIRELEADFNEINEVLAGHVQTVQDNLNTVSPMYRFVDDITGSLDRAVINFSIAKARAESWKLATTLAPMSGSDLEKRIEAQDKAVRGVAYMVLKPHMPIPMGLLGLRITERRKISRTIEAMARI
jgi:hypothetical protein